MKITTSIQLLSNKKLLNRIESAMSPESIPGDSACHGGHSTVKSGRYLVCQVIRMLSASKGVKWCRSRMIASASVLSPSQPLRCTARDLTVHQQPKNTAVNAPLSYCALLTHVVVISVTDNCLLNLVGFARQSCHLKGQDLLHLYGNNIRQRLYNFQLAMLCDADSRKRQTRFIAECHKNVTN
jgi:hypothetical protein